MIKDILFRIREQREKLNYSQKYIAEQLDLNIKSYSNIENGNTELTLSRFIKIAGLLKMPPEHLINPNQQFNFTECKQSGYLNNPQFYDKGFEEAKHSYQQLIDHLETEIKFLREQQSSHEKNL